MKRQILPLLFAFCAAIAANAQPPGCPDAEFTLGSQAEVDAFDDVHPDCTDLTVKMIITGGDITNLDALAVLNTTTKAIEIISNPVLTSVSGLSNLTSVGGNLLIDDNTSLTTLNGMGSITDIGGYLFITFNPALTDLAGFDDLTDIGNVLQINNNGNLTGINGLNSLGAIGGYCFLSSNSDLATLNGLNSLTTVGGFLEISDNNVLNNLSAFTSLTTVTGYFSIENNSALTNIDEFDLLTTVGGVLTIANNGVLSDCVSDGICAFVAPAGNQATITNNDPGCNTETEVEDACEAAPVELVFFKGKYENEEVMLTWETASEQDNSFFEVERSLNGKNFDMLGKVMGNGTTLTLSDYQFRHANPSGGLNYYRLKQVDFDGKFQYSNIVSVLVQGGGDLEIFPNPTKGPVSLRGQVEGERTARVTDLAGRVILEKNLSESSLIDLSGQPNGIYFIEIQTNKSKSVKRVIKE